MKRFYTLFLMLIGLMCTTDLAARKVVKSIGEPLRDLSLIQPGDELLLFCNGTVESSASDYGTRAAFLMEGDENKLYISRNLQLERASSSDFIWKVLTYKQKSEGYYEITLQSPRGNYVQTFPYDESSTYEKWPGLTGPEADIITVSVSDYDSLFYFNDINGIYFNGQNVGTVSEGVARFVGWNSAGANSLYKIYRPVVESKETYTIEMIINDELGQREEDGVINVKAVSGDVIEAPEWEHHSFDYALDLATGESVEMPYTVTEEDKLIDLYYISWPLVVTICKDESGKTIHTSEVYYEPGASYVLPTQTQVGLGYELVTTGYDNYAVTESQTIELTYRKSNAGLPFVTTTVEGDELAADTRFYFMKIRGGYINYVAGVPELKINNELDVDNLDAYVWAVTGSMDEGFNFYNKSTGATMKMYAATSSNSTPILLGTNEDIEAEVAGTAAFNLSINKSGFSLAFPGDRTACMNRFGGTSGTDLKIWNDNNSPTDDGSRIVFEELTAEFIDELQFGSFRAYLRTEGCVNGYTAGQLADLRTAIEAKDEKMCTAALNTLQQQTTIAFDPQQAYIIESAFAGFAAKQPEVTYVLFAAPSDSIAWGALNTEEERHLWSFETASDTTFYLVNVGAHKEMAGFRFGKKATLVGIEPGYASGADDTTPVGEAAAFQLVESTVAPAAFRLVHNYGPSIITLSCEQGVGNATATGGTITTYNTDGEAYANIWRLRPAKPLSATGIDSAEQTNTQPGAIYDLSGRRVTKPAKGLYIMNGKKVIVR